MVIYDMSTKIRKIQISTYLQIMLTTSILLAFVNVLKVKSKKKS